MLLSYQPVCSEHVQFFYLAMLCLLSNGKLFTIESTLWIQASYGL